MKNSCGVKLEQLNMINSLSQNSKSQLELDGISNGKSLAVSNSISSDLRGRKYESSTLESRTSLDRNNRNYVKSSKKALKSKYSVIL